jgi:hypothetical protein
MEYGVILFLFCFGGGIGDLTQDLHLEPLHQSIFVIGFLKIGFLELFAWAGLKP